MIGVSLPPLSVHLLFIREKSRMIENQQSDLVNSLTRLAREPLSFLSSSKRKVAAQDCNTSRVGLIVSTTLS